MQIKNNVKIHNRFDIEIIDKNTGELKQSLVSYNIVLNQMYTRLCGGLPYFVNIHFGSGTGTLSPSRTTLFTHLGTKAAADEEIIKAIPLSVWKRKIVLNPEEFVGNTISEVGVAFGSMNTNLVTHSLLKDSEGNSISIIKTDVDVITIYATVFVTFDTSNPNLSYISMPSSNQLVNYLIGGSTAPTGAFSLNDVFLAVTPLGNTSSVTWTSDTVNKQRKTNILRFATTIGNGHVKYLDFTNLFSFKLPSLGIFDGFSYSGVTVGIGDNLKKTFDLPSANIRNNSIVIRRNGVVVSNYLKSDILGNARSSLPLNYTFPSFPSAEALDTSNSGECFALKIQVSPYLRIGKIVDSTISWLPLTGLTIPNVVPNLSFNEDGTTICYVSNNNVYCADYISSVWVHRPIVTTGSITDVSINGAGTMVAVSKTSAPYINIYDWNGTSWVLRTNPNDLPTAQVDKIRFTSDGLVLAIIFRASPYFIVYDWNGTNWIKRPNASVLPTGNPNSISLSQYGDAIAIGLSTSPYFISYDFIGGVWIKRVDLVNPAPTASLRCCLNNIGSLVMIGSGGFSDNFARIYRWIDNKWELDSKSIFQFGSVPIFSKSGKYTLQGSNNDPYFNLSKLLEFSRITFDTPPTVGDVITADYIVDGVHKTDQFVIDASFAIQFGEI